MSQSIPMSDTIPFETNEHGHFPVRCPVPSDGEYPEAVSITYEGVTYTFRGFVTTAMSSKIRPDVLLYRECDVQ